MGLFGGSSSKTSSNVTEYNFANYGAEGQGAAPVNVAGITLGKGAQFNVTMGDYGAIEAGRSLAQQALDNSGKAFEQFTASLQTTTAGVLDKSLSIAKANQTPESSQLLDMLKQVGIGIAVALAVGMLVKGK